MIKRDINNYTYAKKNVHIIIKKNMYFIKHLI